MSPRRILLGSDVPVRQVRMLEHGEERPLDAIVRGVHERALREGFARGAAAAQGGAAGALEQAAAHLDAFRQESAGALTQTAIEIAIEIARALVRVEVGAGRHDIERIVRDALDAAAAGRGQCVVHLHPDDLDSLRDVRFRAGTSVQADIGVARGDVHVETSLGLLVRELDGALESIAQRMREELR